MNLQTTIGEGLPVLVSYDYSPAEEAKLYGDNVHPGSDASIDITEVVVIGLANDPILGGSLCIRDALNAQTLDAIETECFEQINQEAEYAHDAGEAAEEDREFISRGEYWKRG